MQNIGFNVHRGWFIRCRDNIDTRLGDLFSENEYASYFTSWRFRLYYYILHFPKTFELFGTKKNDQDNTILESWFYCVLKHYRERGQRPSHLWGAIHMCPLATGTVAIFTHSTLSYLLFWSATHWIVVIMCKLDMCQRVSDLTHRYRDIRGMMAKRFQRTALILNIFLGKKKITQSQGWPAIRFKSAAIYIMSYVILHKTAMIFKVEHVYLFNWY